LETQQELEHREYLKREEEREKMAVRIKELESRLAEVSNREDKSRKRLAEVRSTCSREIKLLRNMLSAEQQAHSKLKTQRSRGDQENYNFNIYESKYGYFDAANLTDREIRKKISAKEEAENRRYDFEKHGTVTGWTERDYFRVFFNKDHAATQTGNCPTKNRGISTEDKKWEQVHAKEMKLFSERRIAILRKEFDDLASEERRIQSETQQKLSHWSSKKHNANGSKSSTSKTSEKLHEKHSSSKSSSSQIKIKPTPGKSLRTSTPSSKISDSQSVRECESTNIPFSPIVNSTNRPKNLRETIDIKQWDKVPGAHLVAAEKEAELGHDDSSNSGKLKIVEAEEKRLADEKLSVEDNDDKASIEDGEIVSEDEDDPKNKTVIANVPDIENEVEIAENTSTLSESTTELFERKINRQIAEVTSQKEPPTHEKDQSIGSARRKSSTPRKLATESRKSPRQRRSKSAKVRRKSKGVEKAGAKRKAESKSPPVAKEQSEPKTRKKRKRIPITTVSAESNRANERSRLFNHDRVSPSSQSEDSKPAEGLNLFQRGQRCSEPHSPLAYESSQPSQEELDAAELRAENEDEARCSFSPVDNRPVFSVEKSPDGQDTLYKKLGIDLSMTVPDTSKAIGKLCPEVRTPGLTLINDLGLQLSETKMNSPEMFASSPTGNQRFENVKRKIIDEKPKYDYSSIAGYILHLIEKHPSFEKFLLHPTINWFDFRPSGEEVFYDVARKAQNILKETQTPDKRMPSTSNFPESDSESNSVLDYHFTDFSLPP